MKLSLAVAFLLSVSGYGSAFAEDASEADAVTRQAVSLFKEGKLQDAVELEDKVVKQQSKEWLPHAAMSFFYWQQGNVLDAVTEGQKAVRYAPHNELALTNLAHMYQLLEGYQDAIPLYDEARKIAPASWEPVLGLARCYIRNNHSDEGLAVLKEMATQNSNSFDWNYHLGYTYLTIDKPGLAVAPLDKAMGLSATPEQKSASTIQLFLALLRDNQVDRARAMMDPVFNKCQPKLSEVYVRAASALLPVFEPSSQDILWKSALENLKEIRDSDVFFRLGKVFEDKADHSPTDTAKRDTWLANAAAAFDQAIELNPGLAEYHLAFAAILSQQGKLREMSGELAQARSFNRYDLLTPYLVSSSKIAQTNLKEQTTVSSTTTPAKHGLVNLTAVRFKAMGLTCNCQSTKIDATLSQSPGVVFATVAHLKPYDGIILVDQSLAPVKEVFAKCPEKAFGPAADLKTPITFDIASQQPVTTVAEAVRLAQSAKYGDVLKYPREFDPTLPVIPVTAVAERSGSHI